MLIVNCICKLGGAPNALGSKNPPANTLLRFG